MGKGKDAKKSEKRWKRINWLKFLSFKLFPFIPTRWGGKNKIMLQWFEIEFCFKIKQSNSFILN